MSEVKLLPVKTKTASQRQLASKPASRIHQLKYSSLFVNSPHSTLPNDYNDGVQIPESERM